MSGAKKTRRPITAVRQWKIVRDILTQYDIGTDDPVYAMVEKLQNAALEEVANQ